MPKNQLPFDVSFAHNYEWQQPESELQKALQIMEMRSGESHGQDCLAGQDGYRSVSTMLANNPHTPEQVLEHLGECVDCPKILESVAGHPNVNSATLKRLSMSVHDGVRSAVADNSNADIDLLRDLAQDGSVDVRFCMAENPNMPAEILQELSNDENPYVAYRAQSTMAKSGSSMPAIVKTITPAAMPRQIRKAM